MLFFVTNRLKLFLLFKREQQTANATVRPWSRDIFRFAVSHEKPDAKDVYLLSLTLLYSINYSMQFTAENVNFTCNPNGYG